MSIRAPPTPRFWGFSKKRQKLTVRYSRWKPHGGPAVRKMIRWRMRHGLEVPASLRYLGAG